jgi:WD40 repeat protein
MAFNICFVHYNYASCFMLRLDLSAFRPFITTALSYYLTQASTWADKGNGLPLLVLAGKRGIIKVINTITLQVEMALSGHGNEIMDVTTHSVDTNLVLSASRDESVRLWNLRTQLCVAIFAGEKGHRSDVLNLSVHPIGNIVASSGIDHCIKLWNLDSPDVKEAISKSYLHDDQAANIAFVPHVEQFPIFSTDKVHINYVDCVQWVGDLILSKSTCNRVALWTPDPLRSKDAVCVLREFALTSCQVWFMKMSVSDVLYVFAAGNTAGEVQLFHLTPPCDLEDDAATAANHFVPEIIKANINDDKAPKHERFETGVSSKPNATICHESGVNSSIRDSDFSIDGDYFIYCSSSENSEVTTSSICVWSIDNLETFVPVEPDGANSEHEDSSLRC